MGGLEHKGHRSACVFAQCARRGAEQIARARRRIAEWRRALRGKRRETACARRAPRDRRPSRKKKIRSKQLEIGERDGKIMRRLGCDGKKKCVDFVWNVAFWKFMKR